MKDSVTQRQSPRCYGRQAGASSAALSRLRGLGVGLQQAVAGMPDGLGVSQDNMGAEGSSLS